MSVSRVVNGLSAWLEVEPDAVKAGDNVTAFITVENLKDYKQTWPVELVDDTGNIWWPKPDDYVLDTNYTLSKGVIAIRPHKTAHIMVTDIEVYQNTTFYFKVGGITMAMAYVEVNGTPYLEMTSISCGDLWLNPTSGGLSDIAYITYGGTVDCKIGFVNPHNQQVGIQLKDSSVSVDFPMSHSRAVISDGSATTFSAHGSGYLHVKFSASISDFRALANYWVYGYYDLPVTIRLHLVGLINNIYQSHDYTIRTHVTVKTSNTVYGAVTLDITSWAFIGKEGYELVILAKDGKKYKVLEKAIETFIIPFVRALEGSRGR